ncbi:SCO6745 family protein [Mycobacterium sp. SMC-11]|uniref:SCO6745 family protein n=1 Tax=Mycobacterium sp. SMC-11 TaxID=3385969 RepID=UPI00390C9E31
MGIATGKVGATVPSARDAWRLLEPLHAVVYFSPEPLAALDAAGYRGFWMGYFAGRAAPLGAVGAEVVHAAFYNFSFERVAKALPAAWNFAPPEAALGARQAGAVAALRRHLAGLADGPAVARAAELAARAASAVPITGRVLGAANHALPLPDPPLARLWQAATVLREHRGDGHIAALLAAGIEGRESHVFHALASRAPRQTYTVARDFTDDEWNRLTNVLRDKGLAGAEGLTPDGVRIKAQIEEQTDRLAAPAYEALTDTERHDLIGALQPLAQAVVAAGEIPIDSPMGLDLRPLLGRS